MAESTVKRPVFARQGRSAGFEVRVVGGVDAGRSVTIAVGSSSAVFIGRNESCGLALSDALVSARHCSLQMDGGRLLLRDLSSASVAQPTRVNGVEVKEAILAGGEVLRVGSTVLFVRRVEDTRAAESRRTSFGRVRGESAAICALYPIFEAIAREGVHALIEGERGAGKRLLAQELHADASAPFVTFEGRDLLEAESETAGSEELFAPGGLLEQASGGTLYITEIRALGRRTQQKLATIIDRMEAIPAADRVRVIAATRGGDVGSLSDALAHCFDGAGGARIALPALRDRDGDVLALAHHFWRELGGEGVLPEDFMARHAGHAWPGNVRELRIAVQSELLHGDDEASDEVVHARLSNAADDILGRVIAADLPMVEARHKLLAEFEKRYVVRALSRSGAHVGRAARASGIAVRYFQVLRSRAAI